MVKLVEGHLHADVFTHLDEGNSNHSKRGEGCVRFGFFLCILLLLFEVLFDAVMWLSQWWSIAWILRTFPVPAKEQASTKICAVFEIG